MASLSGQFSEQSSEYSDQPGDILSRPSSAQSSAQSSQHSVPSSYGDSLYHRLHSITIKCDDTDKNPNFYQRTFLPTDAIDEVISTDIIKAQLSRFGILNSLFNPCYKDPCSQIVKRAKKVFVILGLCELEKLIWEVVEEGLTDEQLPLARFYGEGPPNILISRHGKKFQSFSNRGDNIGVENFLRKQWQVLAPVFTTLGEDLRLDALNPLPFYGIKKISFNDRSTVYKGTLHGAHFMPKPKDNVKVVAIKDYTEQDDFDKEKKNLGLIQDLNNPHLIRHIATIQQGNSFYVIFPWANGGNLSDFWKRAPEALQTRSPKLFMWCLEQMLGIVDALFALHNINCRHGDLKPENILHFKDSNESRDRYSKYGILVIADVGVSRVHHVRTELRDDPTNTKATTPCYEAPEVEIHAERPRGRRYDMWSVGCMFMEFAIWLLYGNKAIDDFKKLRRANDDRFPQKAPYYKRTRPDTAIIHPVAFDGLKALENDPRCAKGTGLAALVSLIASDLIVVDPEKRAKAGELRDKLRKIVQKAKGDSSYLMRSIEPPPSIPDPFRPGLNPGRRGDSYG